MEFLKTYSEIITLIFSGIVAISTVFYVKLTSSLVKESRKIRKAQIEPQIIPYFTCGEVHINLLYLTIKNLGPGIAYNVKFEILKEFSDFESDPRFKLAKCGIIENGMKYFPPKMKHRYFIGSMLPNAKVKIESVVSLKVHYENLFGAKKVEIFELNLNELEGISRLDSPDSELGQISHVLEKINKVLEKPNIEIP